MQRRNLRLSVPMQRRDLRVTKRHTHCCSLAQSHASGAYIPNTVPAATVDRRTPMHYAQVDASRQLHKRRLSASADLIRTNSSKSALNARPPPRLSPMTSQSPKKKGLTVPTKSITPRLSLRIRAVHQPHLGAIHSAHSHRSDRSETIRSIESDVRKKAGSLRMSKA